MRIKEIINETVIDPLIDDILTKKGYKPLGSGMDQQAYLEPGTGLILKIFGTSMDRYGPTSSASKYTEAQHSFVDFANYCHANPNNEFLPYFSGWERFKFNGSYYIQIRMERLFPFTGATRQWGHVLEFMADKVYGMGNAPEPVIRATLLQDQGEELITHLGEEGAVKLIKTLSELSSMANRSSYYFLDLHDENFMMGSDGQIVISDPFWTDSY